MKVVIELASCELKTFTTAEGQEINYKTFDVSLVNSHGEVESSAKSVSGKGIGKLINLLG